jgi:hypothetical protein
LRGHWYEKSSPSLAGEEIDDSQLTPWNSEVEVEKAKERLCEDGVVMKITDRGKGMPLPCCKTEAGLSR